MRTSLLPIWVGLLLLATSGPEAATRIQSNYSVDVPPGFVAETQPSEGGRLSYTERKGGAIIDVYGGDNIKHLSLTGFVQELSKAPRIADITYQARGRSWFVISGHYVREMGETGTLIYYAKFLFSSDHSRFAAFEISYPVSEKSRMDPVVTELEKTLRLSH